MTAVQEMYLFSKCFVSNNHNIFLDKCLKNVAKQIIALCQVKSNVPANDNLNMYIWGIAGKVRIIHAIMTCCCNYISQLLKFTSYEFYHIARRFVFIFLLLDLLKRFI